MLFRSCGAEEDENGGSWQADIGKAQAIRIVNAETDDMLAELTGNQEIEAFVTALDLDRWKLSTLPDHAESTMIVYLSQEPTKTLWNEDSEDSLEEVGHLTVYPDVSYITVTFVGFSFDFEVPQQVMESLQQYAETEY